MKRILILKSSSLVFSKVMARISKDYEITTVVCRQGEIEEAQKLGAKEVICLDSPKGFRLRKLYRFRKELHDKIFDKAVCLYNNHSGAGYLNVDLFVWASKAQVKLAYAYNLNTLPFSSYHLSVKALKSFVGLFWIGINVVLSLLLGFLLLVSVLRRSAKDGARRKT